jgi:hypothetical protein
MIVRKSSIALAAPLIAAVLLVVACSGDDDNDAEPTATQTPTASADASPTTGPSPTPAQPDPRAARGVFDRFVDAAQSGDFDVAWTLYAASISGQPGEHRDDLGCDRDSLEFELPKMAHWFDRAAPFEVLDTFRNVEGSTVLEFSLLGTDGEEYLATLVRVEPHEPYRLITLNSGKVSAQPGVPDPLPSPEDPQGFCGIWTGVR